MIELIASCGRMLFKTTVLCTLLMHVNASWIWAVPFSLVIGIMSEAEILTSK